MILFILLTVLAVGIICFLVGQYWEQQKDKRLIQRPIDVDDDPEPKYNRIKRDLDQLLLLYEQEVISEEQYFFDTDQLIDELARLLDNDLNGKDYAAIRNP